MFIELKCREFLITDVYIPVQIGRRFEVEYNWLILKQAFHTSHRSYIETDERIVKLICVCISRFLFLPFAFSLFLLGKKGNTLENEQIMWVDFSLRTNVSLYVGASVRRATPKETSKNKKCGWMIDLLIVVNYDALNDVRHVDITMSTVYCRQCRWRNGK